MNFMKRSVSQCALTLFAFVALLFVGATNLYAFTTPTINLVAYSGDGENSGVARLSANVSVVATVRYATNTSVTWSLQGAGSLSSSGLYSAPSSMPSNRQVIVKAKSVADSAVTASYTMYLENPVPTIRVVYPQQLPTATTQSVTVYGNGFVPGSVILVNGSAVSTSYVSSTELTTKLSIPDSASGSYTFAAKSPSPGGGTTAGYSVPVALKKVTVDAYNSEGVDTHTARLGLGTQFTLTLSGPGNPACTWKVQGGGTISSSGLYQAPSTMPSSSTVTVTGTLVSNSAVHATYQLSLLNPVPSINETSPAKLTPGKQNNVTVRGFGFTPGTTILVNGNAVRTTYQSPESVQVSVTPSSGSTWINMSAHNPNPGAAQSSNFWVMVSTGNSATATVSLTRGRWIPQDFFGLSHEWNDVQNNIMGSSQIGTNQVYRQLLKNLMLNSSYPFLIRIGGGSTDSTGEPDSRTIPAFAELAKAMGVQFTLGVNLGSDNVNLANDQAKAYMSQMPSGSIRAFEVGNEPDTYITRGYRSSSYSFTDFNDDFTKWSQTIQSSLGTSTKFMGPAWANLNSMPKDLSAFQKAETSKVSMVSEHWYPGHQYIGGYSNDYLLSESAASSGASYVAPYVTMAHNNSQKFRIGEINSIDEGGITGISDTFSSALWAVDTMFELLKAGVDGVNWHTANDNCAYCAFTFGRATVGGTGVYTLDRVSPIYYGWLLFQEATLHGTQLLSVDVNTSANVKTWATIDKSNVVRVVVINKDKSFNGNVRISIPGYSGTAQVTRLVAPGYQSTEGVSIGGQTFDGSIDGTLVGSPANETLGASNGVYYLSVQPTSAVLLTITN